MASNVAAWQTAAKARPFEVKSAPYTSPGPNEIVVKNHAIAINPVDWGLQAWAIFPLQYPAVLGEDVAGEVVEVGSACSRLKAGDRVVGMALGVTVGRACESAFQKYTVLQENLAADIPSSLSFEKAAVLPLCLFTAIGGLFLKDHLGLQMPSISSKATDKTLLVWGGASSVGCNAIQLAVAAGYEVFTTASPKNFDFVKKLGASQVFDYNDSNVVDQLVDALKGKSMPGVFDSIGESAVIGFHGAVDKCVEVASRCDCVKFVASTQPPPEHLSDGEIKVKFIDPMAVKDNGMGKAVFAEFLPRALAEGKFVAAPEPEVVGHGLESVQSGIDTWKKGVSAKKVVISL
ncbi:MAG: hypothetical protein M1821_009793 [Bathelium mastoideum]|nr:MAG: hypothetical protein M1821_009793 [Bathelium mastoideum]KAI9690449.1 MAG: hypothetical protein M1822_009412 [Bathelium mastoideum]